MGWKLIGLTWVRTLPACWPFKSLPGKISKRSSRRMRIGVRWNEHAQRTFTCADIGARWKLRTQRAGLLKLLAGMIWARAGWAILTLVHAGSVRTQD